MRRKAFLETKEEIEKFGRYSVLFYKGYIWCLYEYEKITEAEHFKLMKMLERRETMKKDKESCMTESQPPLDLQNKFAIQTLERQVKQLESRVRILDVIALQYAKANGIKIERFQDLVIISQV